MSIVPEQTLSNPMVIVGRPPPPPPPPKAPQESLEAYWYVVQGVLPINKDTADVMYGRGQKEDVMKQFMIRTVDYHTMDLAESMYQAENQEGVVGFPKRVHRLETGVLVYANSALISGPYHPVDRESYRNGVKNDSRNEAKGAIVYYWDVTSPFDERFLKPHELGTVHVVPKGRNEFNPTVCELPVPKLEENSPLERNKNKEVNAFTLTLGIEPGAPYKNPLGYTAGEEKNNVQQWTPWLIEIQFGDIHCQIQEGRPEMKIKVKGRDEFIMTIQPGTGAKTTTSKSDQNYQLTFIPVWNGILVSDAAPSAPNFREKIVYIQKKTKWSVWEEIDKQLVATAQQTPPKWGKTGERLPKICETNNLGQQICQKAIFVTNPVLSEYYVNFGDKLVVSYYRCGGVMQFIPVYFCEATRSHLFLFGDDPAEDNPIPDPDAGKPPQGQSPLDANIKEVPNCSVVPVWSYAAGQHCGFRAKYLQLVKGANPVWCITQEFHRAVKGFRRPMETWGVILYTVTPDGGIFRNRDGLLTAADIPQPRIRSCSINRTLDGESGTIVWDRYDPVTGLFTRPAQNVGAVRIMAVGGIDTIPDIIMTPLGMGNAESDAHDSNTIEIPLQSKAAKMTDSEGGLRVINAPFFDGVDHREAMKWLADYGGVPFKSYSGPYKLPSGTLMSPVVDIKTGTPIWDAMQEIAKMSSTLVFFDRYGVLRQYDTGQTSGVNWDYPASRLENYNDKPDLTQMRDTVVVAGLVSLGTINLEQIFNVGAETEFRARLVTLDAQKLGVAGKPLFPWSKMMFYAIPGILKPGELQAAARKILKGVTRPRASASVQIPGNGQIELLDTFNSGWVITSVAHNVDTQSKNWRTTLSLELLTGQGGPGSSAASGGGAAAGGGGSAGGGGGLPQLGSSYNSSVGAAAAVPQGPPSGQPADVNP